MNRFTFKKGRESDGRMRLAPSYSLRLDGKDIATVQRDTGGAWFWYGFRQNSLWVEPAMSLEDAKKSVLAAAKAHLSSKTTTAHDQ